MSKYKQGPVAKMKAGPGTAVTGKASGGSLTGKSNQPSPPTPWPLEGRRPYGGPDQPQGQPTFSPKGGS